MSESPAHILLVEDEIEMRRAVERILQREGHHVTAAADGESALDHLSARNFELVITDLVLPGLDGFEILSRIRMKWPFTEVIMFTGHGTVERAVEAIKSGAYDFVQKGREDFRAALLKTISKALEKQALAADNRRLLALVRSQAEDRLVGQSRAIRQIRELVHQIAPTDVPVLIRGESGTGKEIVGDLIHSLSARAAKPFVKLSCAAIPETLLESELFGYERGAFSGAFTSKAGRFELANGGSIFLDEIGEMAPPLQAKLLRVLEDGRCQRLGSTRDVFVDVRVISATNADIDEAIRGKRFRGDLYYRLNVVEVHLPPLRERREDIALLAKHFLRRHAGIRSAPIEGCEPEVIEAFEAATWPGNVRELENTIQRALALARGPRLTLSDVQGRGALPRVDAAPPVPFVSSVRPRDDGSVIRIEVGTPLETAEERIIAATLKACGNDKEKAARMLGISSRTIYRRMDAIRRDGEPEA
jgi:two-component system response regulator HydG